MLSFPLPSNSKDENGKDLYNMLDIWNVQTHTHSRTEQNVMESNPSNEVKNQNSEQSLKYNNSVGTFP